MDNGPRLAASDGEVVRAAPPSLLDTIKDDLNIPLTDTTNDAWLQRRIDNVWARFEKYCCRVLPVPPAQFVDDWSLIAEHSNYVEPPMIDHWPVGSPFLRYCPVISVDAITRAGTDGDASKVMFEPASGKLFGLDGVPWAHDVSFELRRSQIAITYTAGWTTIPGDLYEALLGCIAPMWQARAAQQAGGFGSTITEINVTDVGSVQMSAGSTAFINATLKGVGINDPMLGPWITLLDSYVDARVQMGSPLIPVTRPVTPP